MITRPDFALELRHDGFVTRVLHGDDWRESLPSRALDSLTISNFGTDFMEGEGDGFRWRTQVTAQAGGFLLETTLHAEAPLTLNPAMILWLGALNNMDDRQSHTWRQTILRAPTTNQNGLGGNDLPACYLYDHAGRTETICYFPPDAFAWTPHRFYDLTMREVMLYRPEGRYGVGLLPNAPEVTFTLPVGEHRFAWWFTQRPAAHPPTAWEAQRRLIEAVTPLLDPMPMPIENRLPWDEMARRTLQDLDSPDCWIEIEGQTGLRAYVRGSSALRRDEARGFELMTQLDVLFPLLVWREVNGSSDADALIEKLRRTLPLFARPQWEFVANNYPPRPGDSFMDTWYFLENALIKLPWAAYLLDDPALQDLFFTGLRGAQTLAHNTRYLFPLFADASDWQPRGGLLNVGVGGLYAVGCLIARQLRPDSGDYLTEAANALLTIHSLPPGQLYHEPQQLSFAAAAANYLARHDTTNDWRAIARDFVATVLRMGYWGKDSAVPYYDPRGMFQACASLCYPAYKENVETILPWSELLTDDDEQAEILARIANLQRQHNYAFFDPYLPENLRRGTSCAYVPYEDVATAEFSHTAELGKELYGAGEVFWSALLFEALPDADILCLSLDVPCVELKRPGKTSRRLLYNPTGEKRTVTVGASDVHLPPGVTVMKG